LAFFLSAAAARTEQVSSLSSQLHRLKSGRGAAHAVHADDADDAAGGFGGVAKAAAGMGRMSEIMAPRQWPIRAKTNHSFVFLIKTKSRRQFQRFSPLISKQTGLKNIISAPNFVLSVC
jgi:hypothetical protein